MLIKDQLLCATLLIFAVQKSLAIDCYQCASTDVNDPFQCNEWLSSDADIQPTSCDSVFGAKYCVKHVGRFEASSIKCYQCSASKQLECSDGMIHMSDMEPDSCNHVFEAQYCIKSTSLDGGIGTKRFCSSLNLGNYCNFVQQPGDKLSYRTCIFTCNGDACNPAHTILPTYGILIACTSGILLYLLSLR